MSKTADRTVQRSDIPGLVKEALVDEYGESQDRCVRGYVPSRSITKLMDYLDPDQIQAIRGSRQVKDKTETFAAPSHDLPPYVEIEEQLKRELVMNYDRADRQEFDWGAIKDYLVDSDLKDIAISKLVLRMDNDDLRDHLFRLLRRALNYPSSYKSEFSGPFYFVMESRAPQLTKDYDNIDMAHEDGYLKRLGWNPRTLDLVGIWSHYAWAKSGNKPLGVTQHEVEELAFNQREADEPVFGAVNSKLVVNRWRTPFGSGMTDMRHFEWDDNQRGWVRSR